MHHLYDPKHQKILAAAIDLQTTYDGVSRLLIVQHDSFNVLIWKKKIFLKKFISIENILFQLSRIEAKQG
jgi:hypothetical protein